MNEMGIIAPDFGKDFQGVFFDHLEIHLTTSGELTQSKQEFLEKYTNGLIRNHFIGHPTAYSNWELSHHNPKVSSRNRYYKNFNDIKIGDFQAQWNKHKNYAANPLSINEVGCIHTSQGMEFDYVGVIIGDDLIYRNGRVLTDYTKHPSKAGEFRRPHKQKIDPKDKDIIDRLIRNTYRVLFQRGLRGAFLYVMDYELKEYLKNKINKFLK